MLNKLSNRQKAKAALAVLSLKDDDKGLLDSLIKDYLGHPIVGALVGKDVDSTESLVEGVLSFADSEGASSLSQAASFLGNKQVRGAIAKSITQFVSTQPENIRNMVVGVVGNLSSLDVDEFNKEFDSIEHFIGEGLLSFFANQSNKLVPLEHNNDDNEYVCDECGHIGELP